MTQVRHSFPKTCLSCPTTKAVHLPQGPPSFSSLSYSSPLTHLFIFPFTPISRHTFTFVLTEKSIILSSGPQVDIHSPFSSTFTFKQILGVFCHKQPDPRQNSGISSSYEDFPAGTVDKGLLANAAATGSTPGPGRSHMLQGN